MVIHNYRDLVAWQKAMNLARAIYRITKSFPAEERYALTSQIQRAVTSIPTNIAEGSGRATRKELVHFLTYSLGSAYEVETELVLAHDFGYVIDDDFNRIQENVIEVQKLIYALIKKYKELSSVNCD